jgi:hypothetical protein
VLQLSSNQLKWLPAELGQLTKLEQLYVRQPIGFCDRDPDLHVQLDGNPLPAVAGLTFAGSLESVRRCALCVNSIVAATTHIGMIRERATEICVGLQSLGLPAFVTLQIVDEAVHENSIRMWAKWELITAVKHHRDRRE